MTEGAVPLPGAPGWLARWWAMHFSSVSRKEAWGYGVWFFFGALVAVPELWAAISSDTARWPTISATVGNLEYHHPWVALIVVAVLVGGAYSALRFRPERTGVLPKEVDGEDVGGLPGDPTLPYRTAEGQRLTMAVKPIAEINAGLYFGCALAVVAVGTAIAAATSDVDEEFTVGQTLYGLTALFWIAVPTALAWPRRWSVDIPFPTMVETVRNLERRLRGVALTVAAGLVILLVHLIFYPWPATIPDVQDLHKQYEQRGHPVIRVPEPQPPEPTAP